MRDGISALNSVRDPPICADVGASPIRTRVARMRAFCASGGGDGRDCWAGFWVSPSRWAGACLAVQCPQASELAVIDDSGLVQGRQVAEGANPQVSQPAARRGRLHVDRPARPRGGAGR
jgi:hypothetical protein